MMMMMIITTTTTTLILYLLQCVSYGDKFMGNIGKIVIKMSTKIAPTCYVVSAGVTCWRVGNVLFVPLPLCVNNKKLMLSMFINFNILSVIEWNDVIKTIYKPI